MKVKLFVVFLCKHICCTPGMLHVTVLCDVAYVSVHVDSTMSVVCANVKVH